VPRGRPANVRRSDDVQSRIAAAEAELADLDAAEAIAERRYRVAGESVQEAWDGLEAAQRERDDARADRARVRDQRRQVQARIRRLHKRAGG